MRMTLAPVGTASDVFPMLAVAKALHTRGHIVTMCAAEEFRSAIYKAGFPLFSNGNSYRNYLEAEGTADDVSRELAEAIGNDMAMHFVALRDATRHADAIVGSRMQIAGVSMAEQLKIPYLYLTTSPRTVDYDCFPIFGVAQDRLQKRRGKRLKEWDHLVLTSLNRERKLSHLQPVKNLFEHLYRSGEVILALDPVITTIKAGMNQHVTGFSYFEDVIDVDDQLTAFLNDGPPPIYVAPFRTEDSNHINALCEALVRQGHRVVIGYGWHSGTAATGCIRSNSLSYAQIFPHMSVVIHGGASDVAIHAIRARVPQVIAPFTAEQSFWAEKVSAVKAGTPPVVSLATLDIVSAVELALKMADEVKRIELSIQDGADAAAAIIEKAASKNTAKA